MGCFGNLTQGRKVAGPQKKSNSKLQTGFCILGSPRLGALALKLSSRHFSREERIGQSSLGGVSSDNSPVLSN